MEYILNPVSNYYGYHYKKGLQGANGDTRFSLGQMSCGAGEMGSRGIFWVYLGNYRLTSLWFGDEGRWFFMGGLFLWNILCVIISLNFCFYIKFCWEFMKNFKWVWCLFRFFCQYVTYNDCSSHKNVVNRDIANNLSTFYIIARIQSVHCSAIT